MNISLKIILAMMILLNFSCSSNNQNADLTKANSLQTVNQAWGITAPEFRQTPTTSNYPQITRTEIKGKTKDEVLFQKRNLSQYDKTNTSNCHSSECKEDRIRNFIAEHWENKKRGYIASQLVDIDILFTEHIFIEPTENGEWRILWRVEKYQYLDDFTDITSVEKEGQKLILKSNTGEVIKTL